MIGYRAVRVKSTGLYALLIHRKTEQYILHSGHDGEPHPINESEYTIVSNRPRFRVLVEGNWTPCHVDRVAWWKDTSTPTFYIRINELVAQVPATYIEITINEAEERIPIRQIVINIANHVYEVPSPLPWMSTLQEMDAHIAEQRDAEARFCYDLEEAYRIPHDPTFHGVFKVAWDIGHSNGLSEVQMYYQDLVETIVRPILEYAREA